MAKTLFGGNMGARALAAMPFALRKKLVLRSLQSGCLSPLEIARFAGREVPFYQRLYRTSGDNGRFDQLPLVTQELLAAAEPHTLLAGRGREEPGFLVASAEGAPGYFANGDLLNLGAVALLHPRAGDLAAALRRNAMAVSGQPFGASLLGPTAERLLRFLGGCVLNVDGLAPEAIARHLVRVRPTAVVAPLSHCLGWLDLLSAEDRRKVTQSLSYLLHIDPSGPVAAGTVQRVEQELDAVVIQAVTDGFSYAFFGCSCGAFHPAPHLHLETLDDEGQPALDSGRLVLTDLARKSMPLVRYETGGHARITSTSCPVMGQTTALQLL